MSNPTLTPDAAAATIAAARVTSTRVAHSLNSDDDRFRDASEAIAVSLDESGCFDEYPFAALYDAAYSALADRCANLL